MKLSTLKQLVAVIFTAAVFGLISCGPDPEPKPNPEPSGNDVSENGVPKYVISEWCEGSDENPVKLFYDRNGRVIKMLYSYGYETFNYSSSLITLLDNGTRPDCYWDVEAGLVRNFYDNSEDFESYEYNSQRQLTKIVSKEEYGRYIYETELSWDSNNITYVKWSDKTMYGGNVGQSRSYELKYGYRAAINRECIPTLNRLAMTLCFGLYPAISVGGYFGQVPESLIVGCTDTSNASPYSITYGNFDENGCPETIYIKRPSRSEEITLKWGEL